MAIDIAIRIGGEGGEGVISSGDFLMQAAARAGFEVMTFKSFPAEIKGGYALSQVRFSDEKILSQGDGFDIVVCFNEEAYQVNKGELAPGKVLVYDGPDEFEIEEHPGVTTYAVPMSHIAKNELKAYISKNMVAMGAVCELFGFPVESLRKSIHAKFIKKSEAIVEQNYKALEAGAAYVREHYGPDPNFRFPDPLPPKDVLIVEGNQAIALGAMAAGCRFLGAYPITPATTVGNYAARLFPRGDGYVYQAEDEIAGVSTAIGASFVGTKAMTCTSGPGIDLKSEMIGLAAMAEIPVVIADIMRGGPSTGMPTKHDQADLFMAAHAFHGDTTRAVIAASNVEECFYLTIEAFNLAEKYQIPVLLLSDAALSLQVEAMPRPDLSKIKIVDRLRFQPNGAEVGARYDRYKVTDSGISPMSHPGDVGGNYAATGLQHGEDSSPRTSPQVATTMNAKRWRKLEGIEDEIPCPSEGVEKAKVGIIAWGLTANVVREAMSRMLAEGMEVAALYPKLLFPVQTKEIEAFAARCDKLLLPEANYQGQFAQLIRAATGIDCIRYNIYRGEPFIPREIVDKVKEIY
ncbi:MAG: 2-oxoacid:acceptor oxidoreductase subunit alpha [Nitrospirae bacterium]|nr:MAG: 2-oxoacid:acceptor oxidoreductase subunit alpha [Nitrospirota bacterium]